MRWLVFGLFAAALVFGAPSGNAQQESPIGDDDRANYNTVYGEKLTSVKRTRSESDDLTLAQEMMSFAADIPEDPGVQCLIYIDAITLAANAADLGMMNQAAGLLQERWPNQDAVSPEAMLQLASRAYRGVERRDRDEQGEHYIELLLGLAERHREAEDLAQAESIYRLASTIARTIDSDQNEYILNQIRRISAASETARRIEMLERSVEKNPQNSPAAKELVKLLVTHKDDAPAALKYVASTSDEEMIDLVQHCAKGIDQADAAAALRIGDWYATLAEDEGDELTLALLRHASAWYNRFFALYSREDALAKHVASKQTIVKLKIEQLAQDEPAASRNKDKWVSLIAPPYDAKEHKYYNPKVFEVNDGQITIEDGMFYIPVPKAQSYEIRLTLTTPEPTEEYEKRSINVDVPIGDDRYLQTRLFVRDGTVAHLSHVEESLRIDDAPDRSGKKIQFTFQVSQEDDETKCAVLYNGKLATSWKGNYEQLQERVEGDIRHLPTEKGNIMMFHSMTPNTIHAVDFRAR